MGMNHREHKVNRDIRETKKKGVIDLSLHTIQNSGDIAAVKDKH